MNFGEFLPRDDSRPSDELIAWARAVRAGSTKPKLEFKHLRELDVLAKEAHSALGHLELELDQDIAYLVLWKCTPWWRKLLGLGVID